MHPYAGKAFAGSLAHWGTAMEVPEWGCHVIVRDIGGGGYKDAAGVYPITPLAQNADIAGGLQRLKRQGLVSVVLVLDDFHRPSLEVLAQHFPKLQPFKPHYIYRPGKGPVGYDSHHRRALKKAQVQLRTGIVDIARDCAAWCALYDGLTKKLQLTGLHAFPHAHHQALAKLEGMVALGAWLEDELVSCHVWAYEKGHAHSHLVASNQKGYDTRGAYAVNHASIEYFSDATLLNFGGGAGNSVDGDDGLARFKRGFSNDTAQSYICGAIIDQEKYDALVSARNFSTPPSFFPAYRAP